MNLYNENLYCLVNWCYYLELWSSKCIPPRGCYYCYCLILFFNCNEKIFQILIIHLRSKYFGNMKSLLILSYLYQS